ncbi:BrnT family toxin [Roseixanthobacter liquoris]|uniref:BrnT family toxin n=1 Tax=Roseixanthobacter liquoris TaxID=3119921 RepID=UPI003726F95A
MSDVCFEWDEAKNEKNVAKHGIGFAQAAVVLAANRRLTFLSAQSGEERYVSIIEISGRLFAVIHLQRGQAIRIISVRRARKSEEKQYRALYP